jgi:hypothetical protein
VDAHGIDRGQEGFEGPRSAAEGRRVLLFKPFPLGSRRLLQRHRLKLSELAVRPAVQRRVRTVGEQLLRAGQRLLLPEQPESQCHVRRREDLAAAFVAGATPELLGEEAAAWNPQQLDATALY